LKQIQVGFFFPQKKVNPQKRGLKKSAGLQSPVSHRGAEATCQSVTLPQHEVTRRKTPTGAVKINYEKAKVG